MKTRLTIIALGALAMLAGCGRSEVAPDVTTFNLSVRAESDATRATVNGSGNFAWTSGDQIAVHLSTGYQNVTITPDNSSPRFGTTQLTVNSTVTRDGYAIFPASVAAGTASAPTVTLPASYGITSETATGTPLPMVAVNDPDSDFLHFHHVGGLVRIEGLTLPAGTTSVTVTFNKGVTGSFEVSAPATAEPTITAAPVSASNSSVTFAITGTLPTVLNVPVPCGEYAWVKVYVNDATAPFTTFDGFTLGRAQGIKLTPAEP